MFSSISMNLRHIAPIPVSLVLLTINFYDQSSRASVATEVRCIFSVTNASQSIWEELFFCQLVQWPCNSSKILQKVFKVIFQAKELLYFLNWSGLGPFFTLDVSEGSGAIPVDDMMWPKSTLTQCFKNWHFWGYNFKPACFNRSLTCCRFLRCSSNILPIIIRVKTRQDDHWSAASTESIWCWRVAGTLQSPKGITLNSKWPSWVQNMVLLDPLMPPQPANGHFSGLTLITKWPY